MNPLELEHFRSHVDAALNAVLRSLRDAGPDETRPVAVDPCCVGPQGRVDAVQQQAVDAGWRETLLREKRRLEAARARLDEGTFGTCCRCGEPIARERLEADPGAPFCAACQAEIEAGRAS